MHWVQLLDPLADTVPAAHFSHAVAPAFEYVPAGQALHFVDAPLSRSAVPDAHWVQTVTPAAA